METQNKQEPPRIRVVVRKRPRTSKELKKGDNDILEIRNMQNLAVKELKTKVDLTKYIEEHNFTFDNVFDENSDNQEIYQICVQPLINCTFQGAKTTCFAYGQTGSGKTFTMMGPNDGTVPGLYLLAANDIITQLMNYPELQLYVSFYEIYCGKLYDLFNLRELVHCREDHKQKVNIVGLTEVKVDTVEQLMSVIGNGLQIRTSGVTGANQDSSRSHAILQLQLKKTGGEQKLFGKMSFIDLAGSERGADTIDQNKQTRMDGAEINKSLLALKECIRALDLEKKHLPFRGSKLTQVLKDSFTGNSKTTMIANVSPANSCCEHTLNTLRYADRVKELKKDGMLGSNGQQPQQLQHSNTIMNNGQNQMSNGNKSKDVLMSRELMLARQSSNVTKIQLNQNTLQPKNQNIVNNSQYNTSQMPTQQVNLQKQQSFIPQISLHSLTANQSHSNTGQSLQNTGSTQNSTGNQQFINQFGTQSQQKHKFQKDPTPQPSNLLMRPQTASVNQSKLNQIVFNQQIKNPLISVNQSKQQPQNNNNVSKSQKTLKIDEIPIASFSQLENQYGNDVESICGDHEKLVEIILEEEEEMINGHRQHIDDVVDLVKQEMMLLHEVDKPGSDIEDYVLQLDNVLLHKMELISVVRQRLVDFYTHLKLEENLQKLYQEKQAMIDGDSNYIDEMNQQDQQYNMVVDESNILNSPEVPQFNVPTSKQQFPANNF